jgi:hypothetical protein
MPDLQAFKSNRVVACRLLPQCLDQNLSICFFCGLDVWVVAKVSETTAVIGRT